MGINLEVPVELREKRTLKDWIHFELEVGTIWIQMQQLKQLLLPILTAPITDTVCIERVIARFLKLLVS